MLRYWLAALRLEEALQVRPAARQLTGGATVPRMEQPTPGQDYFKVPLDASFAALLAKQTEIKRPFDAELCAFFETWLYGQYRRSEDENELSHLVCFPVIHLPRGELAGLVRCGVRLRFGSDGAKPFQAPKRAERQRGAFPAPPSETRLTRSPPTEGAWPFFVDTRLLHQTLAVPTESIDALFEALRTLPSVSEEQMLALLTTMLESVAAGGATAPESVAAQAERLKVAAAGEKRELASWLEGLTTVLRRLLERSSSRARVYPVGIVVDGTKAKATWHLQREIEALVSGERGRFELASPLGAYLTGQPLAAGEMPQRALFPGPGLTASQRAAAQSFWGSGLSAVQGPPGTGKTRLILHLCAEALVRQVEALLNSGRPTPELFVVTSSNNRAVDNVIEPLSAAAGLPLALRGGSRQACEQQLLPQLQRVLSWLQRAEGEPASERAERLSRAKARFRQQRDKIEKRLAPRRAALARVAKRAEVERELLRCELTGDEEAVASVTARQAKAVLIGLEPLEQRLYELSKICELAPTAVTLRAIESQYRHTQKRHLPAVTRGLSQTKLTLDLPLPPPTRAKAEITQQIADWEDAAEIALTRLTDLRGTLERAATFADRAARSRILRAQLAAFKPEPPTSVEWPEVDDDEARELFASAVAVREAWASDEAPELIRAISSAIRVVEQERSLRPFFRDQAPSARWLCSLFGIWGSTLLSLANCFTSELGSIARLVIDEAGQCHPAHAASGLMRAKSALVIGDVHQLAPVVELGVDDEARLLRTCRITLPPELLAPYRVHADATSSTQSLADRAVEARGNLTDHFRCQPEIIALSDALCGYGLTVHTPRADRSQNAAYLRHPLALVDLRGEQARLGGSWCNELELGETLALVESLLGGGVRLEEIAVITPYRGQLERLRRGFVERRISLESSAELAEAGSGQVARGLALGTVHRFQGGERSIVVFSSVITHPASLGFLNARPNLLNVAISRAQHHFICLGHAALLAQGRRSRLLVEGATKLAPRAYGGAFIDLATQVV